MNQAWIPLIAALGGGAVVKLIEIFFIPKASKEDFATKLRDELRTDIKSLRAEITRLQTDLDEWKKKYYDIIDRYSILNGKYNDLLLKYEDLSEELHHKT